MVHEDSGNSYPEPSIPILRIMWKVTTLGACQVDNTYDDLCVNRYLTARYRNNNCAHHLADAVEAKPR